MLQRTFNFVDESISTEDLGNGRHVVKVTPGGARILAYVSDGTLSHYEAEDASGDRQPLFSIVPDSADSHVTPDGLCEICTFDATFGGVFCYTVLECPPPVDRKLGPKIF
jgi:hypothetical protein